MDIPLLPHVNQETLNLVVNRLKNREVDYLNHITQKIAKYNPVLHPSDLLDGFGNLPIGFGVYELLDLSLTNGKKLPRVDMNTLDKQLESPLLIRIDPEEDLFIPNTRIIREDGNNNVVDFIRWLEYTRPGELDDSLVLIVYSALREQERKNRILSN